MQPCAIHIARNDTHLIDDHHSFDIEAQTGAYRLSFDMSDYEGFADRPETFFPEIVIEFQISDAERHHHVPVVVSGFGYSTYLGN